MELTGTDFSIDILTAIIFLLVIFRGLTNIYLNHLSFRAKAYTTLFVIAGGIYVFQAIYQMVTNTFAPNFLYDLMNGINCFLAISIVTLLAKREDGH